MATHCEQGIEKAWLESKNKGLREDNEDVAAYIDAQPEMAQLKKIVSLMQSEREAPEISINAIGTRLEELLGATRE